MARHRRRPNATITYDRVSEFEDLAHRAGLPRRPAGKSTRPHEIPIGPPDAIENALIAFIDHQAAPRLS